MRTKILVRSNPYEILQAYLSHEATVKDMKCCKVISIVIGEFKKTTTRDHGLLRNGKEDAHGI